MVRGLDSSRSPLGQAYLEQSCDVEERQGKPRQDLGNRRLLEEGYPWTSPF